MSRVLLTGVAGFVGHHLADYILNNTDWEVVGLDRIDCAGNLNRLAEIGWYRNKRAKFIYHDLRSSINDLIANQIGEIDYIFHIAAASHVDRSIADPMSFVQDNVVGTCNLLEYARRVQPECFLYFSTDEVFGPAKDKLFSEWDRYNSGSPYSATKAGAEELCLAYHNTYKVPVIITHCMNIFGERQHPEKFIPKVIKAVINRQWVQIYADKKGKVSGSRNYIYAEDVCKAILFILDKRRVGDKYNIGGEAEMSNIQMGWEIANIVGKHLHYRMVAAPDVRPGNDFKYGLCDDKLRSMGFTIEGEFLAKLVKVVKWYMGNPQWL